jgi:hypothetical protein
MSSTEISTSTPDATPDATPITTIMSIPATTTSKQLPNLTIFSRVASIPLVNEPLTAIHTALANNPYTSVPYITVQNLIKTAYRISEPIQVCLAPVLIRADNLANKSLNAVQSYYPTPFTITLGELKEGIRHAYNTVNKVPYQVRTLGYSAPQAQSTSTTPPMQSTPPEPKDQPTTPSTPKPLDPREDPASGVLYNPIPNAPYPPPWYRSQSDEPGPPRARAGIVGGLIIPRSEGWEWFKRTHGIELSANYSQDINIVVYMEEAIHRLDHPYDIDLAQRRDVVWYDFLLGTQYAPGPFLNTGPEGLEEVLQDDLKDKLTPGKVEDEARKVILQELGRWIHHCVSCD